MGAEEMTFTLNSLLSIIFGAGGALGVWFKLKGAVNILKVELAAALSDLERIEKDCKEDKKVLHMRADNQKALIEENRKTADRGYSDLKQFMNDMKVEIIREIHKKD